jgi:hypothetical protein
MKESPRKQSALPISFTQRHSHLPKNQSEQKPDHCQFAVPCVAAGFFMQVDAAMLTARSRLGIR